jgi:transcriptional regulator with XRE-family HTH domain
MSVGEIIKYLREAQKRSARSLSLECGYSSAYIGKVESGEIEPSFRAFAKIARALHMNALEIDYIISQEANR